MNEIIKNLYIGDMIDGRDAPEDFNVLCVMWDGEPGISVRSHKLQTTNATKEHGIFTVEEKMEAASLWIHKHLEQDKKVLVHCAYGIERSPLTVVWYLMDYHALNLKQAYDLVLEKRPEAQYRGTWLPEVTRIHGVLPSQLWH